MNMWYSLLLLRSLLPVNAAKYLESGMQECTGEHSHLQQAFVCVCL